MPFRIKHTYDKNEATSWSIPNYWDIVAIALVFTFIVLVAWGAKQMTGSYRLGDVIHISLNPVYLPQYALRTTLRLFIALLLSLLFTFTVGTLAAKNKHAERLIIPIIDILQSVPVLSFLSIATIGFILVFKKQHFRPRMRGNLWYFHFSSVEYDFKFLSRGKNIAQRLKRCRQYFTAFGLAKVLEG
jgi:NitT/TauT family transport system permease protein